MRADQEKERKKKEERERKKKKEEEVQQQKLAEERRRQVRANGLLERLLCPVGHSGCVRTMPAVELSCQIGALACLAWGLSVVWSSHAARDKHKGQFSACPLLLLPPYFTDAAGGEGTEV